MDRKQELVSAFRELFVSREDVYAKGSPRKDGSDKYEYYTARDTAGNDLPLTDDVYLEHFKGAQIVGVYPILPGNLVGWAALDFDGEGTGTDPIDEAYAQSLVFKKSGLFSYVERSRSGTGAHVWLFFDRPIKALVARQVVLSLLLDSKYHYDRMFPNQATTTSYGNLIALPYFGQAWKKENSCFLDDERKPINPYIFLGMVRKNSAEFMQRLFDQMPAHKKSEKKPVDMSLPVMKLPGALKMCNYCNWFKQAKERMPEQNQEPSLYALACQLSQLEGGERILRDVAALHPYDDDRVTQKWDRANKENKPQTCATLRAEFGDCFKRCDQQIEGVNHPYDLAKISFVDLEKGDRGTPESYKDIAVRVIDRAKKVYRNEITPGIAYGWDCLDNFTELRNGDLVIIAARPSIGKTAALIDLAVNISTRGTPVSIASLEMTREQFTQRSIARVANVDSKLIDRGLLTQDDWRKVLKASQVDLPYFIDDKAKDIDQILDFFGDMTYKHGKGILMLDYLELVSKNKGESDLQHPVRVIKSCKSIAKILDVPIILLAQLNRVADKEQRDGEEPADHWLKYAGEQDADVIIYMLGPRKEQPVVRRDFFVMKERHRGAGHRIKMDLHQTVYRFECRSRAEFIEDDDDAFGSLI